MTIAAEVMVLAPGACSCGVPGCPEKGWPHEWNPSMDDCVICVSGEPLDPETSTRYGSGYAHDTCINPPTLDGVDEPLTWEGDNA